MQIASEVRAVALPLKESVWDFASVLEKALGTDKIFILVYMLDWETFPDRCIGGAFLTLQQAEDSIEHKEYRARREINGNVLYTGYFPDNPESSPLSQRMSGEVEMRAYENQGHGGGLVCIEKVSLAGLAQHENPVYRDFYRGLMRDLLGLVDQIG